MNTTVNETRVEVKSAIWKHRSVAARTCKLVVRMDLNVTTRLSDGADKTKTWAPCPACNKDLYAEVIKATVTAAKCGAKCLHSKGPTCDCSCGGANHGRGHGSVS